MRCHNCRRYDVYTADSAVSDVMEPENREGQVREHEITSTSSSPAHKSLYFFFVRHVHNLNNAKESAKGKKKEVN